MKKRITALFAAACLAASFTPAFAANEVTASVSADKTTAAQGENITVTVKVDGAENVNAAYYRLYYDPEVLEYVTYEEGDLMNFEYSQFPFVTNKVMDIDDETQRGQVTAVVGFDNDYNITDTEFFTVEFRVKADAEPGDYSSLFDFDPANSYVANVLDRTAMVSVFPDKITVTEAQAPTHELEAAVDNPTPSVGDTVTYTISASETAAFNAMQFDLDFDPSVLEFVGGEFANEGLGGVAVNGQDNTKVNYVWVSSDAQPVDISGTVATATFKVISVGDATVTASNFISSPDNMVFTMPQVNIAGTGVLSFECDNDTLTASDVMHVSVKAGSMEAQQGIQFDVKYDNSMLRYVADSIKINEAVNSNGITSTARLMEDGNIRFVLVCTDNTKTLSGDAELFSFDLKPAENAEGTAQLSFEDIAALPLMSSANKDITVYGNAVSEAVENVETLINAIPEEITDENYNDALAAYNAAKDAYDALTDDQKPLVNNYEKLLAAAAAFGNVAAVVEAIEALAPTAETYVDSKAAVEAARAMYGSLTDAAKANVTNYDKLTAAEETVAALTKQVEDAASAVNAVVTAAADNYADAKAAAEAYRALTESQKSAVVLNEGVSAEAFLESFAALEAQIDSVEASISAIGAVTADNAVEKKELIDAARAAYDALNEAMRADVENYDTLVMAEALYVQYVGIEITVTRADASYTVDINDLRGSAVPQTVIIALYEDGIPVSMSIVSSDAAEPVTVDADTANEECRVFVWNSLDGMIPFTGAHIEYAY